MRQKLLSNARNLRANMTEAEKFLWLRIKDKQLGYKFNRQFIFDDKYILDFYCAEKKLIIELDGGQHYESENDKIRDEYLKDRCCTILRFWNNELLQNVDGCLFVIKENLDN